MKTKSIILVCSILLLTFVIGVWSGRHLPVRQTTLKVLCIGNSFSIDAVEQNLVELAMERGVNLTVGNLYIGGCSLEQHATNFRSNAPAYSYRLMTLSDSCLDLKETANVACCKQKQGMVSRTVTEGVSILDALLSDEWDIVTMQQASHYSGQWFTYEPYLSELIDSVHTHVLPKTKLYWYMTWAYQHDASHPAFVPNYNGSQQYMFDEIVGCNKQVLRSHSFDGFIPGGLILQQAREELADTLCRDGYHLSYHAGRYLMACVWLESLTGKSAVGCHYYPEGLDPKLARRLQKIAHKGASEKLTF